MRLSGCVCLQHFFEEAKRKGRFFHGFDPQVLWEGPCPSFPIRHFPGIILPSVTPGSLHVPVSFWMCTVSSPCMSGNLLFLLWSRACLSPPLPISLHSQNVWNAVTSLPGGTGIAGGQSRPSSGPLGTQFSEGVRKIIIINGFNIGRNEIMPIAWHLPSVIQSEVSQKNKYYILTFVESRKVVQMNLFAGQEYRHRHREQRYGHQSGKRGGWTGRLGLTFICYWCYV